MQNLEAVDGEEAAEDALLEASPEHDDIILLIHGRRSVKRIEGSEARRGGEGGGGERQERGSEAFWKETGEGGVGIR